ncbi:MAG: hypothetical protein E7080_09770 [Bacteroidales bacterium]|nr:hypothetical protein [Bacteroidales bacterium]
MSEFLNNAGLSRLVYNIENKFQTKKTHCKLWNNGGYWTITIDNRDYEIVRDGAALYEVLKDKLDNLTFDIIKGYNDYLLYNVNYNTYKDDDGTTLIILTGLKHTTYDEPSTDIFKVGIWLGEGEEGDCMLYEGVDIDITNLSIINKFTNKGDGTKLLADDGKYKEISALHYTGTIKFAYNKERMNMQGDGNSYIPYFGDTVYGTYIGVFNRDTGHIKYNSGIYKLVMTRGDKDIYVGDCIVEIGGHTTVVIKRVKGSNYYFAKATQYTLSEGEESYQPGYFDIACIDIEDNTDMYDKHIVEHNPHKNDDVVEICEDGATLSMYPTNQGFCKIVTEYMEGQRKFCPPYNTQSSFPSIHTPWDVGDAGVYINLDSNYEDVTILSSGIHEDYCILDNYLGLASNSNKGIHKKVVRIINDESIFKRICICHLQNVYIRDDKFIMETNDTDEDIYVLYLKPKQVCEITIIKGSIYEAFDNGDGKYFIEDRLYMFANFVNGVEDIVEFDSNGGTISDYYLWLINYFINSGIDIKVKCVAFADTTTQQILDNKVFTITEIETPNNGEVVLKWRCVGDNQSQCILLINKSTGAYEFSTI